jgi:hypothetical protein
MLLSLNHRLFGCDIVKSKTVSTKSEMNYKLFILPLTLITYGTIGIESDDLKIFNSEVKEEINENIDENLTIDDYSQYIPFLSVYALNKVGVRGRNNLKDATLILGCAYGIMGASVLSLKYLTKVERPDGSTKNSFPSGHTATAFMGAEFLYQEFKHKSIWYGIAGYTIAVGTGAFRMYNDRHWFTDVTAGAGFGILSTKVSYILFNKKKSKTVLQNIQPYINSKYCGVILEF